MRKIKRRASEDFLNQKMKKVFLYYLKRMKSKIIFNNLNFGVDLRKS